MGREVRAAAPSGPKYGSAARCAVLPIMAEDLRKIVPDLLIVSPPWPKQKQKILTGWQQVLLSWRSRIGTVFDRLKEHLHLVSSFPRSIHGYLVHYVRILLGYQILALSR